MEGSLRQIRQCSTQMAPSVASAMTGSTSQWQLLLNIKSRLVLFRVRWKRTGKGSYSQWARVRKWLYVVVVVVVTLLVAEAPIGNTGGTFSLLILIVLITHYWLCVEKQWMITCFPLFRKFTVRAVRTRCALRDLIIFWGFFCEKNPSRTEMPRKFLDQPVWHQTTTSRLNHSPPLLAHAVNSGKAIIIVSASAFCVNKQFS